MQERIGIRLVSAAIPDEGARVRRLQGREEIGRGFEFSIDLVTAGLDELDEAKLLEEPAAIEFLREDRVERTIFGMLSAVRSALDADDEHLAYRVTFVPRLFRTSLTTTSEVFLEKTVPEVIQLKLERAGLELGDDFELRLVASYATRDFIMQYGESDHAFVSRLAEHWGISIFFEHRGGKDVAIFSDDESGFKTTPNLDAAPFRGRGEATGILALDSVTRTLTAKFVVDDYNYRTPGVALRSESGVSEGAGGSVTEFGPHCKTPDEAGRLAKVRSEEIACRRRVLEGSSDLLALASGSRTTIEGHPKLEGEVLVVSIEHEAELPVFGRAATERRYRNRFEAISANLPFRPRRVTPKPKIHGAITAIIEAAQGPQYAELDDDGRYHVRFKCDVSGAEKGKASKLVRMAQPHAGAGYGHHFPLRDGVEVMLACIDGDPDRPIITGALPNPQTPSTVGSKNGVHNVMRTGGGTVMDIDDTEGATQLTLATPFASTSLTMGASAAGFYLSTGQKALIETGESITLMAGTAVEVVARSATVDVSAAIAINEDAPAINLTGKTVINEKAPTINIAAAGNLNESAPWIDVKGGAKIRQGAPFVEVNADSSLHLGSGGKGDLKAVAILTLASDGMLMIQAPSVFVGGTVVSVQATTVMVGGKGTVNVTSGGTVNVKAGTINLNS